MMKPSSLPDSDPEEQLEACCDEFVGTTAGLRNGEIRACPTCGQKLRITVKVRQAMGRKINAEPKPPA